MSLVDGVRSRYHILKARAHEKVGAYPAAFESYLQALTEEPSLDEVLQKIPNIWGRLGDATDKAIYMQRLAGLPLLHRPTMAFVARELYKLSDFTRARDYYKRIVALEPTNHEAILYVGECCLRLNDLGEARRYLLQCLGTPGDRDALRWLHKLTQLESIQGRPEMAIETCRRILERIPGEPTTALALTRLLYRAGDIDKAAAQFQAMREEKRADPSTVATLDEILGRLERARRLRDVRLLEMILEGTAESPDETVRILTQDGSLRVKVPDGFAARVKPMYSLEEQRDLRHEIILLHLELGEEARALFHLRQFHTGSTSQEGWARAWEAILLVRTGDIGGARSLLGSLETRMLVTSLGRDTETLYSLGRTYLHLGETHSAKEALKRVLLVRYDFRDTAHLVKTLGTGRPGGLQDADRTRILKVQKSESEVQVREALDEEHEIVELVGESYLGAVFRGRLTSGGQPVGLRRLPQGLLKDGPTRQRFLTTLERASQLEHPHVSRARKVIEKDGQTWFSWEWAVGRDLEKELASRPASEAEVLEIARQGLLALEHAHGRGLLHAALRPTDIIVRKRDPMDLAIVDFHLSLPSSTLDVAPEEQLKVRAPYFPPEFVLGERQDERSNLYTFGMVLYRAWCGKVPFEEPDLHHRLRRYLYDPLPRPTSMRPGLSAATEELILSCLERERDKRPRSARQILETRGWIPARRS